MLTKRKILTLTVLLCIFFLLFQTIGCKHSTQEPVQEENESEILLPENNSVSDSCADVTGLTFSSFSYLCNPQYPNGYSVCQGECIDLDTDEGTWETYAIYTGDNWCSDLNKNTENPTYTHCCAYCPKETHYCPISKSCVSDSIIEQGLQYKLECPYITLSWDKDEKAISYEIIAFYDENKDGVEDGKCDEDISNTKKRYFYYNLGSRDCASYYTGNVRFQIIPQYSDSLSIDSYNTEWIDVSECNIESYWDNTTNFTLEQNTCSSQGGAICEEYEVCDGDVLSASDYNRCCLGVCKLPKLFDWRDRHGENWLTSIKSQGSFGSCQTFGKTAAKEARINLYFNQHIDVDLSEQYILDCGAPSVDGTYKAPLPLGIFPNAENYPECAKPIDCSGCSQNYEWICPGAHHCAQGIHGIVDEDCYPYQEKSNAYDCISNNICSDWEDRLWKIKGHQDYILKSENPFDFYPDCQYITIIDNVNVLKKALIEDGPLISGYEPWGHAMALVGYGKSDYKMIDKCLETNKNICRESGCDSQCSEGEIICRNIFTPKNEVHGIKFKCNSNNDLEIYNHCTDGQICINGACTNQPLKGNQKICIDSVFQKDIDSSDLYRYVPNNGPEEWIFENSWGDQGENKGYVIIISTTPNFSREHFGFKGEVISPKNKNYQIKCVDKDNDGFCNWGISKSKPLTCPTSCKPEKDWDDSNPNIGALAVY